MLSINICINNDNPLLIPLEIIQFDDIINDKDVSNSPKFQVNLWWLT